MDKTKLRHHEKDEKIADNVPTHPTLQWHLQIKLMKKELDYTCLD